MDWWALAETVGLLAGLAAGTKLLWTLIKIVKRKWKGMFGNALIHEKIDNLTDSIEGLRGELVTNSGTSIKDSLNRVEREVALTSERQRARMLDSEELIYETDLSGDYTWVNRTYTRAVQRGNEELIGKGWINVISESYRDEVDEKWYDSVREDREFEMKIMYVTPDGVEFPVMVRSYKMRHNGETIGFLGSVTLL